MNKSPNTRPTLDFSHRQPVDNDCLLSVVDSMMMRANSVLTLIENLHLQKMDFEIDPDSICMSIQMVKRELDDIMAAIDAYSKKPVKEQAQ
jgi:hypothetical protein